ncbi:hypothetical protein SELMODRAFT_4119, partial [Selaginella moellendorffii]
HVNIINLLDVTTNKNGSFMVFELMETDLRHHKRFEGHEIRSFMRQILSGLAWIHSNKIVHQDIKPENLLVKGGVVKLADFGHARRLWEQPRECFGTLSYHSPEQLKGERGLYSTAIDIWAAGCVFAEMVLEFRLFDPIDYEFMNEEDRKCQMMELIQAWNSWSELELIVGDKSTVELMARMLKVDPCKRISAQGALKSKYF